MQVQDSMTKKALSSIVESSQMQFESVFGSQMIKDDKQGMVDSIDEDY